MNFKKFLKFSTIGLSAIIFSGCFSSQPSLEQTSLDKIKNKKHQKIKNNIYISGWSSRKKYKAYIDNDNNLKFIDVYNSNYKPSSIEEIIYFDKKYYLPNMPITSKGVLCGYGSLTGWLCLLGIQINFLQNAKSSGLEFGYVNYSKRNAKVCNSKFSSIDSYLWGPKIGIGLLTWMTPLITGAGVYSKKFDENKFKEAIIDSKLYLIRDTIINDIEQYNLIKGGFDVIYLDNLDELNSKYESLFTDKSIKIGIAFLNKENNNYIVIPFKKYDGNNFDIISLELKELLNNIAKQNYELKYEDVLKFIPPKVKKPKIPPMKRFVKSEFETKKQFQERVKKALQERSEKIQALREKYMLDVFERNLYIDNLQKAYKNYLIEKSNQNNELFNEVKNNIPLLSKILVLEQFTYDGRYFQYDAETQKLYFKLYSPKNNLKIDVYAIMPPEEAKKVKLENKYKIVPIIKFKNNKLILEYFNIVELDTKKQYRIHYADKLYKPEFVSADIVTLNEKIKTAISKEFSKYKQQIKPFTKEMNIVYINNIKYKLQQPKWFSNPPADKIIAFGVGKTYEDAISNARNELAKMIQVKIKVEYSSKVGFSKFKTLKEINQNSKQISNITLTEKDYKPYKQEKVNNLWYVGLEYKK